MSLLNNAKRWVRGTRPGPTWEAGAASKSGEARLPLFVGPISFSWSWISMHKIFAFPFFFFWFKTKF